MIIIANIYFSDLARTTVYQVPILPETMPELSSSAKNEEFETFNDGTYNFLNKVGLVSFTLDSWMPEKANKYTFSAVHSQIDPYLLINLWYRAISNKTPIRCIMERGTGNEILNWMVAVEDLKYSTDKVLDIKYTVSFKEYRQVTT